MMHHGMPFQQLSSRSHAKDKHGGQQALFCRKFMVACEAWEHGHDSKQRHQVEGPTMQEKEWMREFGQCNLWSTRARKSQSEDHHARGKSSQGRPEAPQAGRPRPAVLPYKMHPRCSSSAGKQLSHLSVCVLEFLVQNHLRLSHPSQVSFPNNITPLIYSKSTLQNNS
jgi:hypothetical protein